MPWVGRDRIWRIECHCFKYVSEVNYKAILNVSTFVPSHIYEGMILFFRPVPLHVVVAHQITHLVS